MSPADKRRGSVQHAQSGRSSTPSRSSGIIAAPPKAQLTGHAGNKSTSPSPTPEHDSGQDPGPASGPSASKESDPSSATSKGGGILKEKDAAIAKLQHELSVMESEFVRELDRLSQNENESTNFWRSKHSNLNQQFLRTDTELRLLRAEVDLRDAERQELREGHDALKRAVKERDEEIRSLRGHLNGLKQWVSTNTRVESQVSDEEIADAVGRLGNALQNWVIVHYRRAKLDMSKADQSAIDDLRELVPMSQEPCAPSKVHLLQSVFSAVLVEAIFDSYYVGLPQDKAQELQAVEAYMSSLGSIESVNQWRAATLTLLRKEASEKLQEETSAITDRVVSRIDHIFNSITIDAATSGGGPSDTRDQALRALVTSAVDLARLLAAQRAVFDVVMPRILPPPHRPTTFDPAAMEDIGGEEDEESLAAREVRCVTFPGVTKTGDENGGQTHFRNVIAKIKVFCSPE